MAGFEVSPEGHFGPFWADFDARALYRRNVRLPIQEKVLQLLEALLDQPGHWVSRKELEERLWPGDLADLAARLNTAVRGLREILGDSAGEPKFIATSRGVGYRFIAPVSEVPADATGEPVSRSAVATVSLPHRSGRPGPFSTE
jgi:DNA-binding winged helix-turn-helix (wHTH) protein